MPPPRNPALPALPKPTAHEGPWSSRTKSAWAAWRKDPVTGLYGPADIQSALDLAFVYEHWVRDGTAALASELRQRQDVLGLSPKGKQDRRWRVVADVADSAPAGEAPADVVPLRIVRGEG